MKKQLVDALAIMTRFDFRREKTGEQPAALHFLVIRLMLGAVFSLLALCILWCVKAPLIASCLAVLVLTGLHHYIIKENEGRTPMMLLRQWSRIAPGSTGSDDFTYYQAVAGYCLGIRPLMLFLLLYSGFWYWVLPVYALGGAVGLDTMEGEKLSPADKAALWGTAIIPGAALTLLMNLSCGQRSYAVLTVVLASVVAWLLPNWLKQIHFEKMTVGAYFFIGEFLALLALLCGISL